MKKIKLYKQRSDDCWRTALANFLQVSPKKIPHFIKKFDTTWIQETRKWLKKKHKKSIIYVPADIVEFHDWNGKSSSYPMGRCIVIVGFNNNDRATHALLINNGKLLQKHPIQKYDKVLGYFFIYDL